MIATEIQPDGLRHFLSREPVTVLLYVDSRDVRTTRLLTTLSEVASEFVVGVEFGWMDVAKSSEADETNEDGLVTPCLMFFGGQEAIDELTQIGHTRASDQLSRANLLSWFGKTICGATLIR